MERGVWQAAVHGVAGLDTTESLTLSFSIRNCNKDFYPKKRKEKKSETGFSTVRMLAL